MDTASRLIRAKYEEVLTGEIRLQDFLSWLDAMPIPSSNHAEFEPFLRLVVAARCRLTLWEDGAPDALVLASLRHILLRMSDVDLPRGPDPLDSHKRRYAQRHDISIATSPTGIW